MTEHQPGTLAKVTIGATRDVEDVTAFHTVDGWITSDGSWYANGSGLVTDVRPLVVLDLAEFEASELANWLDGTDKHMGFHDRVAVAREIRKQIKPPRIPEPGLWGVVEAEDVYEKAPRMPRFYLRDCVDNEDGDWIVIGGSHRSDWEDMADPTLIREGIES